MDRLKLTAAGERELVMTRTFDAPPRLVFEAWTTPALVRRWLLGPEGWTMPVCEIDLRVGGAYRYVWENAGCDMKMGLGGVYREIDRPRRLVATERFDEPWYPGEGLVTLELEARDGRTLMTETLRYDSAEARDAELSSPMEGGVAASFDRLAGLLAELPAGG